MNFQSNKTTAPVRAYCTKCDSFYGSEMYGGLCSGCFKKNNGKEGQTIKVAKDSNPQVKIQQSNNQSNVPAVVPEKQADKTRCFNCRKKVGYLGIECKCKLVFCNAHRLPEDHHCEYNHKLELQKQLKQKMGKAEHHKIEEI